MTLRPTLPSETDILVCGGGIIGTATAFELSKRTDREITLVEKDNVASGATGDSSAILRHAYRDRALYSRMAWTGHEFYRNFEAETGYQLDTRDQPLVSWAIDGEESATLATKSYETLQSLDYPVSRHEAEQLPELFPLFEFDDSIDFAVSDDAAGYTDGTDAANGFAKAAADNGTRIITGVSVDAIDADGDEVAGVETDEGYVSCENVVMATGSWTHKLAQTAGVDIPVTPGREQVLLLEPPESVTEAEFDTVPTTGWGSDTPDGVWWYFRADFGDTIYMGTHSRVDPVDPDTYKRRPDEKRKLEAVDILSEFAPKLADSKVVGEFCGVYANTPDQGFIIDQVGPDGLYALVGAGHALKHGPVIGRLAADLVLRGESDLFDVDHFTVDRFEDRSPNQPLPGEKPLSELHMSRSGSQ